MVLGPRSTSCPSGILLGKRLTGRSTPFTIEELKVSYFSFVQPNRLLKSVNRVHHFLLPSNSLTFLHFLNAHSPIYSPPGAVIVYDITDLDSFGRMKEWMKELRAQLGDKVPIVVVGNKCDLESNRQVRLDLAEAEAKKFGGVHFSASARSGQGVKEVFRSLTERKCFWGLMVFQNGRFKNSL